MLNEEWGFLKSSVSEIHVKRIRVNQVVGVYISSGVKIDSLIHFLSSMSIKRAEALFQFSLLSRKIKIKPLLMA